MKTPLTVVILLLSGLLLLAIGSAILIMPQGFYASDGIRLGQDPNLLSEIRAPGGLLASSAILILTGAFRPRQRSWALGLTALVYGSFGCSRGVSLVLDGRPSDSLMVAMGVELGVAVIALVSLALQADRDPEKPPAPSPKPDPR